MNEIAIIVIAAAGAALASYIRIKKSKGHALVCPVGETCDDVINSKYSQFLGMPVEVLGILYYTFITLAFAAFLIEPAYATFYPVALAFGTTVLAFLFSLYSVFVQAVLLKKWCMWCIASAILSTLIFLCSMNYYIAFAA